MKNKPTIKTIINGPFLVKEIEQVVDNSGHVYEIENKAILCRCGRSKTKPFCDGTHVKIGFSEDRSTARDGKTRDYIGKHITIHDNRRICSHPGTCYLELPSVFDMDKKPWINPDGASVEEIIATIKRCYSGALSYTVDGETCDCYCETPSIRIIKHGPYIVQGSIELEDERQPVAKEHYCLCRCGRSKNMPFCDGTHLKREPKSQR